MNIPDTMMTTTTTTTNGDGHNNNNISATTTTTTATYHRGDGDEMTLAGTDIEVAEEDRATSPYPTTTKYESEEGEFADHTTTPLQTALSIFKGNVGTGCLSLPWAYSVLGVPLGCATTVVMTALTTYNAWTLVRLKGERCDSRPDTTYSVSS